MVHEDTATPTMTLVLAMGPKLLVKCSFERNLSSKKREEYTSSEVSELCADAIRVIQRSKIEYEEVRVQCPCRIKIPTSWHRRRWRVD